MTGAAAATSHGKAAGALKAAQQALIDALAEADPGRITAATAEFRRALHEVEQTTAGGAPRVAGISAPEAASLEHGQGVLRETLRARLAQARAALDALGLEANRYHGDASLGYSALG